MVFGEDLVVMRSVEISPQIYWVGHVDWTVRNFHGYHTDRGSTYNAYLIVDEKVALIDTVKGGYSEDLLDKISERVDPGKIDYVISNHTEPDHSSEIARVMERAPQAEVIATEKGRMGLEKYYRGNWNYRVVKTGDQLSLGNNTLQFISTPMLHWPDSMFTYVPGRKILFSMDAFGQHLASSSRYDEEVDFDVLMMEAKTYYANIIMHLGNTVARTLKQASGLDIAMICPSHGQIWRKHIADIVAAYQGWAQCQAKPKVVVIYDTMWRSTELMAETIAEEAAIEGVEVQLLRLGPNDLTLLVTEVLDAAAIAVGSPTLNNHMLPSVAGFLTYLKGLRPKNKVGMTFGSFGWSGEAVEQMAEMLQGTRVELVADNISCQFRPDEAELERCRNIGRELGQIAAQADSP